MKFSIITPVWNQSDLTARFLYQNWAVYAACPDDIEWIIINNGSTDDTPQILADWQIIMGDNLKVITQAENTGFGPGNNRGAEIATGDILVFLSNDVRVLGDYIRPLQEIFKYCEDRILLGPEIFSHNTGWNTFKETGPISYVAGWCVVIERIYWGLMCQWDERFIPCDYEDVDLSYQAVRRGGKLIFSNLPLKHDSGKSAIHLPGGRLDVTLANQKRFMDKWGLTFV